MPKGRCFIGTSGWSYKHWRGPFYPSAMGKGVDQLRFYVERFDTVEVNGTFYRLIEVDTFRRWREQTPPDFVFACKGSRYLTHMKRLKDAARGVGRFFERVEALEEKLGPIVFQLPGRFKPDRERLAAFIDALPAGHRYAFEFRDPAWFLPEIFEALAKRDVALCLYEFAGLEAPLEITAELRLHPPARPRGRLPGLVQRRGAAHLGQAHPRLVRQRASTCTATSTTTTAASRRRMRSA